MLTCAALSMRGAFRIDHSDNQKAPTIKGVAVKAAIAYPIGHASPGIPAPPIKMQKLANAIRQPVIAERSLGFCAISSDCAPYRIATIVKPVVASTKNAITHGKFADIAIPTGTENNPTMPTDITKTPINIHGARRPKWLCVLSLR